MFEQADKLTLLISLFTFLWKNQLNKYTFIVYNGFSVFIYLFLFFNTTVIQVWSSLVFATKVSRAVLRIRLEKTFFKTQIFHYKIKYNVQTFCNVSEFFQYK